MKLIITGTTILLIFFNFNCLLAQETYDETDSTEYSYDYEAELVKIEKKPKFGLFINYGLNYYNTDFRELPTYPNCCSNFESGNGSGLEFGASAQFMINNLFSYGARLSLSNLSGELQKNDPTPVIVNGQYTNGLSENNINIAYYLFTLNPFFSYKIEPVSNYLYSYLGIKAGIPVSATFSQYEKLVKPDEGTYSDGKRIRNVRSGDLPDKNSFMAAITLGLSYEFPLNKHNSLRIAPEVYYNYWLTSPVNALDWSVSQFTAGLAVKYIQPPPPPPPPAEPIIPSLPDLPPPASTQTFAVDIKAFEVHNDGKLSPNVNLTLEDFTHVNLKPLLNYVFFEENSADIPQRYTALSQEQANTFSIKDLQGLDAIATYYNILNIIGYRMREHANATITLTGNNSNKDAEKNNIQLSEDRANIIKKYLITSWGIDANRIKIQSRNLPKEPTRSTEQDADAENRRVEILSSDSKIIESILSFDTVRVVKNTQIIFQPTAQSTFGIQNWNVNISQNNDAIANWSGEKELPKEIEWNISNDNYHSNSEHNLKYYLEVSDAIGQTKKSQESTINLKRITVDSKRREMHSDMEYEYYSLILFDFGSKKLESEHKQVVDFIKSRVKSNSHVIISGYTDYIGDEEMNKSIATARAKSVAQRLNLENAEVRGIGESELLYDNATPEGRFYCRTVTIVIETPVNGE